MASPLITLTAQLEDILGAVDTAAYARITLAGYGGLLPRVIGTCMVSRASQDLAQPVSTQLWGNDVITPAGTFYCIEIFDAKNNIIQSNNYMIVGSGSQDLSTLTPYFPPSPHEPFRIIPYIVNPDNPVFNGFQADGFKITLDQNISAVFINMKNKLLVTVRIVQPTTGPTYTFTWPSNVNNGGDVNPGNGTTSIQIFTVDSDGSLDAASSMQYS